MDGGGDALAALGIGANEFDKTPGPTARYLSCRQIRFCEHFLKTVSSSYSRISITLENETCW